MCLSSGKYTVGVKQAYDGVVKSLAYSLLAVNEFKHNGKIVKLLKLRNPWGRHEWNGAWSDKSSEWTPELDAMLDHTNEDDGTFFIPFNDMLIKYENISICSNPNPTINTQ